MKILLVQPPFLEKNITSVIKYAPMGLLALAAYLRGKKPDILLEIFDANVQDNYSLEDIIKYVLSYEPHILGLSSMTINIKSALTIAAEVKKNKPNIIVVFGGIHPTVEPKSVLAHPAVDFIVIGEGEITCDELLKNIDKPEKYALIDGLGYKENGQPIINKRRDLIKNLDELPIPAYDLIKIEKYRSPYTSRTPFVSVIRSRGCPFRCIFCGVQNMFGRIYRVQSPIRTIKEIDYLTNKFKVREIGFKDSEFVINVNNVNELCDRLIEKKYDLIWSCNARVNTTDFTLYQKKHQAGCHTISFGVESGDEEILKNLKKDITLKQAREAVSAAKKAGIKVSVNFMLGNPGETKETIAKTIKFAKDLKPDYVNFGFATPFPGTELREVALKNNWLIDKDPTAANYLKLSMNATNLSNDELGKEVNKAYFQFYFRPSYLLKRLTMLNNKDELVTSLKGLKVLLRSFLKRK